MDFFTVPTISLGVLYSFFVIRHDRRRILHFNNTKHPTSSGIIPQLREAFPFGAAARFLIHDRDAKYGTEVPAAIRSLKTNAVRTSFKSPWQNDVAERWVREKESMQLSADDISASHRGKSTRPSDPSVRDSSGGH